MFHKCNRCKKEFGLYEKKPNGEYFLVCPKCRSKIVRKETVEDKCGQCKKTFNPEQKPNGSYYKVCTECLSKKRGYTKCNKCKTIFPYENNKLLCDICIKNKGKYQQRLAKKANNIVDELVENNCTNSYSTDNNSFIMKVKFIECQMRSLYLENDIIGDINISIGVSLDLLTRFINKYIEENNILWHSFKLIFKKPIYTFDDPKEFSRYDNIGIEIIN